jgi:AraC-like DNA-binding protein
MSSIEKNLKKILIYYIIVIKAYLLFGITKLLFNGLIIDSLVYSSLLIFTFFLSFIIYRLSLNQILPLIKPFLYILTIVFIYSTVLSIFYRADSILWYMLLIYIFYVLYGKKTTIKLGIFFIFIITISYVYVLLNLSFYNKVIVTKPYNDIFLFNVTMLVLILFFILTFFLQKNYNLYLQEKNNQININDHQIDTHDSYIEIKKLDNNTGTDQLNLNDENKEVYIQLYERLINEFEENKIFLNKDINLHSLSEILNTNTTYLSKAINICTSDNFNTLLNQYRIDYFKNLVNEKENKTYTLKYLYSKSGYKSQSSFYRAFKTIENKTPTEYLSDKNIIEL